jgi:hypothetical protein
MFRAKVCPKHVELILEINKTIIVASRWFSILLYRVETFEESGFKLATIERTQTVGSQKQNTHKKE